MRAPLPLVLIVTALAAGAALAQSDQKPPKQRPPPPNVKVTEPPKTCADQCKMMDDSCTAPCKTLKAGENTAMVQKECAKQCGQFTGACLGSCKEHGYIDKKYMVDRIKPPSPPGKAPAGEGDEE